MLTKPNMSRSLSLFLAAVVYWQHLNVCLDWLLASMGLVKGFAQDAGAVQKSFHEPFTFSPFAVQRKSSYSVDQAILLQVSRELSAPPNLDLNHDVCKFSGRRKGGVRWCWRWWRSCQFVCCCNWAGEDLHTLSFPPLLRRCSSSYLPLMILWRTLLKHQKNSPSFL